MKSLLILTCLLSAAPTTTAEKSKWALAWSDEFNGPAGAHPDPAKWTYDLGATGWGNKELEDYTSDPQNASMDGHGHLAIRAIRAPSGRYTSARLKTQGIFEVHYGRIEIRVRIPRAKGIWPACWLLGKDISEVGWPKSGEIDLMEYNQKEPSIFHGTVHGPGYAGDHGVTARVRLRRGSPLAGGFHVLAVEWSPGAIVFFLDGVSYAKVTPGSLPAGGTWVFDKPFFLLLNVAVGGEWPGDPDSSTRFPQTMLVDWVRVWERVR
jgi:beta-glucanase (GH16 family)